MKAVGRGVGGSKEKKIRKAGAMRTERKKWGEMERKKKWARKT